MATDTLDRLLTALAIQLHSFSVCTIQQGWRLAFPTFKAITVHYVLKGGGALRVGNGSWIPFAPQSVLIVPAHQSHVVGEARSDAQLAHAGEHCTLIGDGLINFTAGDFTAGDSSHDILMVCGAIPASDGGALGLFDLMRDPMVEDFSASSVHRHTFDLMLSEVASPGLGTQAMTELLMKQCLITLLRQYLLRTDTGSPLFTVVQYPRLARAVLAIIENPAASHSVESLASLAGMSRASFAEHFAQAFQQGPIDFVQKVRLRIAARLLTTTDLPVKVIAQSIGYAGPAPFARAFRSVYGIDPTSHRGLGASGERELKPVMDSATQISASPLTVVPDNRTASLDDD